MVGLSCAFADEDNQDRSIQLEAIDIIEAEIVADWLGSGAVVCPQDVNGISFVCVVVLCQDERIHRSSLGDAINCPAVSLKLWLTDTSVHGAMPYSPTQAPVREPV